MKKIEPYKLWLGHAGDGREFKQILDLGIEAIVQLAAEEPPLQPPRELLYLRFPLVDGPGNGFNPLYFAIHNVGLLFGYSVPTLVCCNAGLSRSPAVSAAAIALTQLKIENLDEVLAELCQQYPCDIQPAFWQSIKSVFFPLK
jgi:hypothetical protein